MQYPNPSPGPLGHNLRKVRCLGWVPKCVQDLYTSLYLLNSDVEKGKSQPRSTRSPPHRSLPRHRTRPGREVRSWVNGTAMQDGNTSDMEFQLGQILSYLSEGTTLLPGTIILTGTPPGVGYVRDPPVYLQPGDKVEIELEQAGRLSNPVDAS
ncbi:unnamed protein product [Durusdinium trenchii]|uniref:Fumarylacetoacetase-like C-terminal domain-containing protein n=1 Tax=Durusdinium trenchii TaxID=1381693 RepID=A0ABP0RM59_9DINO